MQRYLHLPWDMQRLFERLHAYFHRLDAKIEAGGRLMLQLLRETQGLFERRQAGSHQMAAKIEACSRLQAMLELL